uniref:Uncharacterized protein n=1 Tax=Rhipicephalus zambeziensis TaxID=60191 RepID=A0A224YG08_9ACAR
MCFMISVQVKCVCWFKSESVNLGLGKQPQVFLFFLYICLWYQHAGIFLATSPFFWCQNAYMMGKMQCSKYFYVILVAKDHVLVLSLMWCLTRKTRPQVHSFIFVLSVICDETVSEHVTK